MSDAMTAAEFLTHEDAAMSEAELFEQVRPLLNLGGWLWVHHRDSRGSNPGFYDIVAVRESRLLFAELKRQKGRLSDAQKQWETALTRVATLNSWYLERYLWRPSDFDRIVEVLR